MVALLSPSSATTADARAAALSASPRRRVDPLCTTALWNRPFAIGIDAMVLTLLPPPDWPKIVTFPGSPPKLAMVPLEEKRVFIIEPAGSRRLGTGWAVVHRAPNAGPGLWFRRAGETARCFGSGSIRNALERVDPVPSEAPDFSGGCLYDGVSV